MTEKIKNNSGLMMKYFVLKPSGDDAYAAASRLAMCEYAKQIEDINPELADDINDWANRERRAHMERMTWAKDPDVSDCIDS